MQHVMPSISCLCFFFCAFSLPWHHMLYNYHMHTNDDRKCTYWKENVFLVLVDSPGVGDGVCMLHHAHTLSCNANTSYYCTKTTTFKLYRQWTNKSLNNCFLSSLNPLTSATTGIKWMKTRLDRNSAMELCTTKHHELKKKKKALCTNRSTFKGKVK